MRKRSMSVFVPKNDDRLSKKFEGVVSDTYDSDHDADEGEEEVITSEWTKSDYEALVSQLKESLPKKDTKKWKTSLQAVNWAQVKVRQHSAGQVEKVARQLIAKVRSYRTLAEILADVPDVVTKLLSAERPKPPLTAYSLFVKETLPMLREQNKDMKVQQIFKLVPKMYQELSAKKRRRFEDEAARLKEDYQANLSKFYQEHPDLTPKRPRKEPLKTPFHLFYQSRRTENVSFQEARKEWEELPIQDKVKYIQSSFDAQTDTDLKLVSKKEQDMLAQALGKPEFMGRNAYEFFRRKMKGQVAGANGTERDQQLRQEYKNLTAVQLLELQVEYQAARSAFIDKYQKYIKKLPKDQQQVEIDFLRTISDKTTKKVKTEKRASSDKSAPKDEPHSADEDLPAAESTTIKKKPKKAQKMPKVEESTEDSESSVHRSSPKKQPKISLATAPPPSSPSKAKKLLSISKSEPGTGPTASSSDAEEEEDEDQVAFKSQASTSRKSVPASPSKNGGSARDTKKRASAEDVKPEVEAKKSKKAKSTAKAVKQEEDDPETPPPSLAKSKKTKTPVPELTLKEPEKPPKKPHHSFPESHKRRTRHSRKSHFVTVHRSS